jgi:Domain of unknown function (DUF4389)
MAQAQITVPYVEGPRNRGTVAIRLLLAIPHLIVLEIFGIAAFVVTVISWFIQVFTGKRNEGMFNLANRFAAYAARVYTYVGLLYDEYPGFIDDQGKTPVGYQLAYAEGSVNRLTVGLRLIWIIPAAAIGWLVTLVGEVLTIVLWFVILFTGKLPKGQYDFLIKVHRYMVEVLAYGLLLTDDYPKFGRVPTAGQPLTAPPVI